MNIFNGKAALANPINGTGIVLLLATRETVEGNSINTFQLAPASSYVAP